MVMYMYTCMERIYIYIYFFLFVFKLSKYFLFFFKTEFMWKNNIDMCRKQLLLLHNRRDGGPWLNKNQFFSILLEWGVCVCERERKWRERKKRSHMCVLFCIDFLRYTQHKIYSSKDMCRVCVYIAKREFFSYSTLKNRWLKESKILWRTCAENVKPLYYNTRVCTFVFVRKSVKKT